MGQFGMDSKPPGTICNKKLDSEKKKRNSLWFSFGKPWLIIRITFFSYNEMKMNLIFKNSSCCTNWFSISLQRDLFISKDSSRIKSFLGKVKSISSIEEKILCRGLKRETYLSLICDVLSKYQPRVIILSEVVWSLSVFWDFPDIRLTSFESNWSFFYPVILVLLRQCVHNNVFLNINLYFFYIN